jgi:hypothetical protein
MRNYAKNAMILCSYVQTAALFATLAAVSPKEPKIKIAIGVYTCMAAVFGIEKLYNFYHRNNPDKQTNYTVSKSILGFIGGASTFLSNPDKISSFLWKINVFTALGAIISPIPYKWLTTPPPQLQNRSGFSAIVDRIVVDPIERIKNVWTKEHSECVISVLIPTISSLISIALPRWLPLASTFAAAYIYKDVTARDEPKLAVLGKNILKSLGMEQHFSQENHVHAR